MPGEKENQIILSSSKELAAKPNKSAPNFEEKLKTSFSEFPTTIKDQAQKLATEHLAHTTNKALFIKKINNLLANTEKELLLDQLQNLITKELEEQQEKKDISQHQPLLSAYSASAKQEKESQIIVQDTQHTQEKDSTISQDTQHTQEKDSTISQDTQHTQEKDSTISQNTQTINETNQTDTTATTIELKKVEEKEKKIKELSEHTKKLQKLINPQYTQHTQEQLQSTITNLSPQTKAKLQSAHIAPLDYASFLLSREKIANDRSLPENAAFLDALKNLENTLDIKDESTGGYPLSFEPQAKTFKQNPDLQRYAQESQDFSPLDQLNFFAGSETHEQDLILIQKFGSSSLKTLAKDTKPLLQKEASLLTPQEQELISHYNQELNTLKDQMENKAKNFMKAGVTNAPICAILKYLDTESLGNQTLTNLLEKPQNGSFAQIHQEGKDQVLHFQGKIDGNPLTFYYNLSNPNASLECDDCLYQDPISKNFTLGKSSRARTKLNIQMPTTEQLASNLRKTCSPEKFQEILTNSSTLEEYQQQLSQLISGNIEKSFSDETLISSRLARHTEKNLAMQTLSSKLIPQTVMEQLTSGKQLNENTTTKKLFMLIDKSSEHMSSSELQTFRKTLQKWGESIQSPDTIKKIQDPVLRSCLEQCAYAQKSGSNLEMRNNAMIQFFNLFTKQNLQQNNIDTNDENYVLNISDFNAFVEHLDTPHQNINEHQHLQRFSPSFSQKYQYFKEEENKKSDQDSLVQLEEEMTASFENAFAY